MSDSAFVDSNVYILSWDMYGLESCVNATKIDQERVWNTLADKAGRHEDVNRLLSMLLMRARANTQRHYEIYSIAVDSSITKEDLVQQFKDNPQGMADLIRDRGNKIYSDRRQEEKILIR